nr:hypothetical protein Itr_chr03CG03970 [Ipomoea trifida]
MDPTWGEVEATWTIRVPPSPRWPRPRTTSARGGLDGSEVSLVRGGLGVASTRRSPGRGAHLARYTCGLGQRDPTAHPILMGAVRKKFYYKKVHYCLD